MLMPSICRNLKSRSRRHLLQVIAKNLVGTGTPQSEAWVKSNAGDPHPVAPLAPRGGGQGRSGVDCARPIPACVCAQEATQVAARGRAGNEGGSPLTFEVYDDDGEGLDGYLGGDNCL